MKAREACPESPEMLAAALGLPGESKPEMPAL